MAKQLKPTPEQQAFNDVWKSVMAIAEKDGVIPLNKLPGLWTRQIGERWLIKVNPQREKLEGVPPFSFAVEFNGWPAGIVDAQGAVIAAGDLANVFTLRDALVAEEIRA